jgi:hypothetical protein
MVGGERGWGVSKSLQNTTVPDSKQFLQEVFPKCSQSFSKVLVKKSSIGGNKYTKDYGSKDAALGYF